MILQPLINLISPTFVGFFVYRMMGRLGYVLIFSSLYSVDSNYISKVGIHGKNKS